MIKYRSREPGISEQQNEYLAKVEIYVVSYSVLIQETFIEQFL